MIGDMITLELDTKSKTIRFYVNDEDLGSAYENVKFDFEQDGVKGYGNNGRIYELCNFLCHMSIKELLICQERVIVIVETPSKSCQFVL